jgi:hypothetical protein
MAAAAGLHAVDNLAAAVGERGECVAFGNHTVLLAGQSSALKGIGESGTYAKWVPLGY